MLLEGFDGVIFPDGKKQARYACTPDSQRARILALLPGLQRLLFPLSPTRRVWIADTKKGTTEVIQYGMPWRRRTAMADRPHENGSSGRGRGLRIHLMRPTRCMLTDAAGLELHSKQETKRNACMSCLLGGEFGTAITLSFSVRIGGRRGISPQIAWGHTCQVVLIHSNHITNETPCTWLRCTGRIRPFSCPGQVDGGYVAGYPALV